MHDSLVGKRHGYMRILGVLVAFALCVELIYNGCIVAEAANGPDTRAESYCVINAKTGEVICEKNMRGRYYPASITKIMTALVVYEHITEDNLDDTITFSHDAVVTYLTSDSSTLTPVAKEGEQMSVNDVLHGMMLPSGNECANALAEYVAGDMASFAQMMNDKVEELGLSSSHFVNASGLDAEEQYVSAYDMAVIMQAAVNNPLCRELLSCKTYTIKSTNMTGARSLTAGHSMVKGEYEYEGEIAGKGGYTALAQRTLVTYVNQGDYELIVVVLKDELTRAFFDVETLFDFAFGYLRGEVPEVIWQECDEEVWAKGSQANIYEFPNDCHEKIAIVGPEQKVLCVGKYDEWYMISINGVIGYALKSEMTNGMEEEETTEESYIDASTANPFYEDISQKEIESETAQYERESRESHGPILNVLDDSGAVPSGELAVIGLVAVIGVVFAGAALIMLAAIVKEHRAIVRRRKRQLPKKR